MTCPKCGAENIQSAKFCNDCGNLLALPEPVEQLRDDTPLRGKISGFQERQVQGVGVVWTFRVERYDSFGNRLPPVPVELRSRHGGFVGFLNEGDDVEIVEKQILGQVLAPKQITNITTNVVVKAKEFKFPKGCLVGFLIVVFGIIGIMVILVLIGTKALR